LKFLENVKEIIPIPTRFGDQRYTTPAILKEELAMLKAMSLFPELVERAALDLAPHRLTFYLQELAGQFHSYYNKHRVLSDDAELTRARLWLCRGLRIIFRNGLRLIGVAAPATM